MSELSPAPAGMEDGWWKERIAAVGPAHYYVQDNFPERFGSLCGKRGFWTFGPYYMNHNFARPKQDDLKCRDCQEVERCLTQQPL